MEAKLNTLISVLVISILLFSVTAVAALANDDVKDKSPVMKDPDIERIDLVHYLKPNSPGKPAKTETCYKLLGVKWTSLPVSYAINPANPQGLPEGFVTGAVSAAAETWDAATSSELFSNVYTVDYSVQYGVRDNKNAISFGDYPDNRTIAVTSYWYSKRTKQILEFDVLFSTRYAWGDATVNPAVMDLQNIATHELGHGVGLNDIYSLACSAVTMYGYSDNGETQKRTLEQPDKTGLQKMYGA